MVDFRSEKKDIIKLREWTALPGLTPRNEYCCHPLTADCIFEHKMATSTRWYNLKTSFRLFVPQLSEVFWEEVEIFEESYKHEIDSPPDLLRRCAGLNAKAMKDESRPYESCVGFFD